MGAPLFVPVAAFLVPNPTKFVQEIYTIIQNLYTVDQGLRGEAG
jgi:hypothetical protein